MIRIAVKWSATCGIKSREGYVQRLTVHDFFDAVANRVQYALRTRIREIVFF